MILDNLRTRFSSAIRPVTEVGWAIQAEKSALIWDSPQQFSRKLPKPASAKSVQLCPAAVDFDARHFSVPCPIDLHLRFRFEEQGKPQLISPDGDQGTVRPKHLTKMVVLVNQKEWRDPKRPILQIVTPYIFLSDEPVYINQLPPFLDYPASPLPGLLIAGRFPINIWPRHLMWAFEWHDISKELILRRDQPWFYVRFEGRDPARAIRLVEADIKPDVQLYIDSISGVTNYINRTFSLFDRAKARRPQRLLYPK